MSANDTFDSLLEFVEANSETNNPNNSADSNQTYFEEVNPYDNRLVLPPSNSVEVQSEDERYVVAVLGGNNVSEVIIGIDTEGNESNVIDGIDAALDRANEDGADDVD